MNKKKILTRLGVIVFWLVLWEGIALWVDTELLLPSPRRVVLTLFAMGKTLSFWTSVGCSLLRVAAGFVVAVVLGTALALLTCASHTAGALLSPLLKTVRAVPVASFIVLAYFWIKTPFLPAFIAMLMVVPLVWGNVSKGIEKTDKRLLEMAQTYRFGRKKTWRYVWLPSVKPYFETACSTGLGFAWKSGIAAEVICSVNNAIGAGMREGKNYLDMPTVFAWTVAVVVLSFALERLTVAVIRRGRKGEET